MKNMKLIWSDEFDYEGRPDPNKWSYDIGGHGWGNAEGQYYTDRIENAFVKDGKLTIQALHEAYEDSPYTSARLTTYEKKSFQYGRIEVSAKLPKGKGTWPAIWMLPDSIKEGKSWPLCGEIDIMEMIGRDQDVIHVSLHSKLYNHIIRTQVTHFEKIEQVSEEFNVYAIEWTEKGIDFYINDRLFKRCLKGEDGKVTTEEGWPFDQPFYLILNIAVGGYWGGEVDEATLPHTMEFEYVRVYEFE